jgi:hypothetical protein
LPPSRDRLLIVVDCFTKVPTARLQFLHRAARRYGAAGVVTLLLAILFLPSLSMLLTIPPLWKDIDAYIQVTQPPGVPTILHYAPLYCFLARVPLYLGYAYDCLRTGSPLPSSAFFAWPTLSDSGVQLLLWAQHAALCCCACLVIVSVTRLFVVRVALAILWAVNPLFYAFAQCVGSEALSLVLLLLLAAAGIKIAAQPANTPVGLWLLFGLLLSLSMLTRHINGVVAAVLPLSFCFAGLARLGAALRRKAARERRWLFYRWGRDLRSALAAVLLGIASIAVAKGTFRIISQAAGIHHHTRVGFTFMFRLNFFGPLSPQEREPLLQRAAANSRSADVQSVLNALRQAPSGAGKFDTVALIKNAKTLLPPQIAASIDKSDEVFNETALAFLTSPSPIFLKAVGSDFVNSQKTTILAVVRQLLQSTTYYFLYPTTMPKCANLVTFRNSSNREFLDKMHKHPGLAFWKRFTYAKLLFLWLVTFIFVALMPRGRNPGLLGYAAALTVIGLLMMLGNCFLTVFQPRFTLPMWELTIVSLTLLLGSAAQSLRLSARPIGLTRSKTSRHPNRGPFHQREGSGRQEGFTTSHFCGGPNMRIVLACAGASSGWKDWCGFRSCKQAQHRLGDCKSMGRGWREIDF